FCELNVRRPVCVLVFCCGRVFQTSRTPPSLGSLLQDRAGEKPTRSHFGFRPHLLKLFNNLKLCRVFPFGGPLKER
ncbi:unnamed protein product, partial [Ectocarpus sp. 12 AP-2014]